MPRIDDDAEKRLSNARSQRRQSKNPPLLIRDDGMLYPNVPLVAKKQNFRPYHGDPKASLKDRMAYLDGFGRHRRAVVYEPQEPFELGKANADEVIAFAFEEYGAALDASLPIDQLRAECYRLSQLPEVDLPKANQEDTTAPAPAPTLRGMGITAPPPDPQSATTGNTRARSTGSRAGRSTAQV